MCRITAPIWAPFRNLIDKQEYFSPTDSHCGAEKMMYLADPEGDIYTCWNFVAMEDMRIGRVGHRKRKIRLQFLTFTMEFQERAENAGVYEMPLCIRMRRRLRSLCLQGNRESFRSVLRRDKKRSFVTRQQKYAGIYFTGKKEKELTKSLKELVVKYSQEN